MSGNDEPEERREDDPLKADLPALNEQIKQVGKPVDDIRETVKSLRDGSTSPEEIYRITEDEELEQWRQFWLQSELTSNPFKFLHLSRMRRLRILTVDEFYDLCDSLDDPEGDDLAMLDLVAKVLRRESGEEIYLAVNALIKVNQEGLESLVRRAKLFAKVSGSSVLPVAVLRDEPDSETVELAKNSRVAIAQKEERMISEESMFIQPEE